MTLDPEQAKRLAGELLADIDEEPSGQFDLASPGAATAGGRIGRYTVLRILGVGGMGEVYEARQEQPDRTVAVKVLRPEFVSAEALRRFELEAEILSRLHHPGIAQVYEAGQIMTAAGRRPYFAMELIDGRPLLKYCAEAKLTLRQKLELFARVCDAVQYAHTQGVVHRDLKPANILVGKDGQPRILDFGIARATGSDLQTTTLQTDVGKLLGTIAYMSPEQASGDGTQVDTRSDVYSLGVVLYELLCGRPPYDLSKVMIHDAARIIGETDPVPVGTLDRALRGDLETIAQKSLEKNKAHRYQTAAEFGLDVRRYLRSEAILARKPSLGYQLAKIAGRHRALVGTAVVSMIAVVGGGVVAIWQAVEATNARDEAVRARDQERLQADAAKQHRDEALRSAATATAITEYLESMFSSLSPSASGRDARVLDMLQGAVGRLEQSLSTEPAVHASMERTFGLCYLGLGMPAEAVTHLRAAAQLYSDPNIGTRIEALTTTIELSGALVVLGKSAEAVESCRAAASELETLFGPGDARVIRAKRYVGSALRQIGRLEEAEAILRPLAATASQSLGQDDREALAVTSALLSLLDQRGKSAEADPICEQTLAALRRVFGDRHPDTLGITNTLGNIRLSLGKLEDAEALFRTAADGRRMVLGDRHVETLRSLLNLAVVLASRDRHAEAAPLVEEVIAARTEMLGADHSDTLTAKSVLSRCFWAQARHHDAIELMKEVYSGQLSRVGPKHRSTLGAANNLAACLVEVNDLSEAERYATIAAEGFEQSLGPDTLAALQASDLLADILRRKRDFAAAEERSSQVLTRARAVLDPNDWRVGRFQRTLGLCLLDQGRFVEAERNLTESFEFLKRVRGMEFLATKEAAAGLVSLYELSGEPQKAEEYRPFLPKMVPIEDPKSPK